jgi:hypothetical protein
MNNKTIRPSPGTHKFPCFEKTALIDLALGNMTQYRVLVHRGLLYEVFIAIEGKGAYPFGHRVHADYATQKLNLLPGDGANMADFINDQLGVDAERQGHYYENLCTGGAA